MVTRPPFSHTKDHRARPIVPSRVAATRCRTRRRVEPHTKRVRTGAASLVHHGKKWSPGPRFLTLTTAPRAPLLLSRADHGAARAPLFAQARRTASWRPSSRCALCCGRRVAREERTPNVTAAHTAPHTVLRVKKSKETLRQRKFPAASRPSSRCAFVWGGRFWQTVARRLRRKG